MKSRLIFPRLLWFVVGLVALLASGVPVAAQSPVVPVVVPVDGPEFAAELKTIDGDGRFVFRPEPGDAGNSVETGGEATIALAELVRWSHPTPPGAEAWVILGDGSLLVTAPGWAGDGPVRASGGKVTVSSDAFGDVTLPRAAVKGVVFEQRHHRLEREALATSVRDHDAKLDRLFLTNGDELDGEIVDVSKSAALVKIDGVETKLSISRIRALAFRGAPVKSQSIGQLLVGLRDGSLLSAERIEPDGRGFVLRLAAGQILTSTSAGDIAYMQNLGGGRFEYLSDREADDYRHIPYLSLPWAWQRDRNAAGDLLSAGADRYLKGIGMHSASRLTYRFDEEFARFDASLAVDGSTQSGGSVTFAVFLEREGKWREVFKSEIVRGGDAPQTISIDTRGAQGLTLMVDYADRGDELDRANWLDARLVRSASEVNP